MTLQLNDLIKIYYENNKIEYTLTAEMLTLTEKLIILGRLEELKQDLLLNLYE